MDTSRGGRLFVIVGLPGSGKSTLARALAARHRAVRLNPDEWLASLGVDLFDDPLRDRLEQRLASLAAELLAAGAAVIIEFGSWSKAERDQLLEMGRSAGAAVELHVLDPSVDTLWQQLRQRNTQPGQVVIDRPTLESYLSWWHPPDAGELARYDPPRP